MFAATAPSVARAVPRSNTLASLCRAGVASTLNRLRRGEGALLAVNLSLVARDASGPMRIVAQVAVSALAIGLMYAFNDLHDAPTDWNNPKKDRALIATWVAHRRIGGVVLVALKVLTVLLALATLGPRAALATAGVMVANLLYSAGVKGVPVVDVAWCGLWGVLYAAMVGAPASLLAIVGLMTAVCHLFQTLDDRVPDALNGITTTAVRSETLSRGVLAVLSLLLFLGLLRSFGVVLALTAFTPLALFFVVRTPVTAWLLTKAYFAVMWLCLLGVDGAAR